MKKKILILAAIAVSGIAAVVASNTNAFVGDADAKPCELIRDSYHKYKCDGSTSSACTIHILGHSYNCTGNWERIW